MAVHCGVAKTANGRKVGACRVAFVAVEAVARILFVQSPHPSIACHFRHN